MTLRAQAQGRVRFGEPYALLAALLGLGAAQVASAQGLEAPATTETRAEPAQTDAPPTNAAPPAGDATPTGDATPSNAAPPAGDVAPSVTPAAPWRVREALGAPDWLWFGAEHRLRFEHLENDFRSAATGDARALSLRTLVNLELRFAWFVTGAELQDSRVYATGATLLSTTLVNPLALLRAYVGVRARDVFATGDQLALTAGRMTLDVGSRRLVARNEFRNTINGFTGVDAAWTSPREHVVRVFAVMPVRRRPSDPDALRDNDFAFDHENPHALLWGAFFGSGPLGPALRLEAYALGLDERDASDAPSANRRLVTLGTRLLRAPVAGELDLQVEAMLQVGRSRSSAAATDLRDLTHRAGSLHLSAGYRVDVGAAPRLVLQYDFASGDRDPDDGVNERFDPLFAARRFEFGPTGLFGAIARSNLHSPGARLELAPHGNVEVLVGYRALALASARDAWTAAAVRDESGRSGRFVGHQLETRLRWNVLPRNLTLEMGGAALLQGNFAERALGAPAPNALYVYTQATGTI